MKVLIIGLDGLEPNLVEKWRIEGFKQKIHGRHYVGSLRTLYTPILWACILTGMDVTKHGYDSRSLRVKRALDGLPGPLRPLYRLRLKLLGGKNLHLRSLMVKLKLAKAYPPIIMPQHLIEKTFIEKAKRQGLRVEAIEVPSYNEDRNATYRGMCAKHALAPLSEKKSLLEELVEDAHQRIERSMQAIRDSYDLVFVYLPLPDLAHHMFFRGLKELILLRAHYGVLESMIQPLLKLASERGYFSLIISDHGFDIKKYYHSEYGFWSMSHKPPKEPQTIFDIYDIVTSFLFR
ncbi:MAG: hypothetical protein DRM97_06925 [Thermoprotei archaeon]|nr:MAG: hypothetical protein DRM97_06925 [Thermoprotei archaeon]